MSSTKMFSIESVLNKALAQQPIVDVHTHLFPTQMDPLALSGPDELLTYHYLKAEASRQLPPSISVKQFNQMSKSNQADVIWKTLFVGDSSPISEAQIGIVTVMAGLGLDPRADTLSEFRTFYADLGQEAYTNLIFQKSGVARVFMTNDPLDDLERPFWIKGFDRDPRFRAVLRLDSALMEWPTPVKKLNNLGYGVENDLSLKTTSELRRYLNDWCDRIDAQYMAISLPPDFTYPNESPISKLMHEVVYPTARDRAIPSAMMVGVRRQVNPILGDGGDSLGNWDTTSLENIARNWPDVNFLLTILSRENQHELCVAARKFPNILPFGCWWFLNNPSIIKEITYERLELLGTTFIPQHSDARILDQLLYKWTHSLKVIAPVLCSKYESLRNTGWPLTESDVRKDVARMFGGGMLLGN